MRSCSVPSTLWKEPLRSALCSTSHHFYEPWDLVWGWWEFTSFLLCPQDIHCKFKTIISFVNACLQSRFGFRGLSSFFFLKSKVIYLRLSIWFVPINLAKDLGWSSQSPVMIFSFLCWYQKPSDTCLPFLTRGLSFMSKLRMKKIKLCLRLWHFHNSKF